MSINSSTKNIIAISILSIVGSIFVFKYGDRLISNISILFLIVAIYVFCYVSFVVFLRRFDFSQFPWLGDQRFLFAAFGILIFGAIVIVTITTDASRVTRYSAIIEWLERLLAGQFPWGSQTQFNPSGLPILFIMALPFYYLGNLGYLEVIGIVLFFVALFQFYPQPRDRWLPIFSLILLPPFYYELLVRSELFFNTLLVISIIALSERFLNTNKLNFRFFVLAILFGFGLSTRTIMGLVYAGYYAYKFRDHIWQGILFSGITLIFFGFTILPFITWNGPVFLSEGPFSVQMGYLPTGITVIFISIATVIGWQTTNIKMSLFYSGFLLFFIVVVAFSPSVIHLGADKAILKDGFDITYFIFCIPFLLLSIENQQSVDGSEKTG